MRYRLVVLSGFHAGRVREVDEREVVLGRDPEAAQIVFDPQERRVSRRHATLREENGTLVLRDLESSTGTFVEQQRVEQIELKNGDVFELGQDGPRVRLELGDGGTLVVDPGSLPTVSARVEDEAEPESLPPGTGLRLTFVAGEREGDEVELAGATVRFGRDPGNSLATPGDRLVSAQHAKLVRLEDGFVLMDLDSTNGTFLNERRVERSRVREGDVIGLGAGGPLLRVSFVRPESGAQATVVIPGFAELAARGRPSVLIRELALEAETLTIGRAEDADVRLDSPIVSKRHARVSPRDGTLVVEDLDSANGTFVGGRRVASATLAEGERFVVGPFELELAADRLRLLDTRGRTRLEARDLSVQAASRTILDGVSLTMAPGSFTALIGPSGAGKSTLLAALSGARQAGDGQVLLNDADLYRCFESLKAGLGYVPQEDIVHRELTVGESLEHTARLRLPADTTAQERTRRIDEVLATLELSERRDTPVHSLSGGQRKRVSIAAELLTEPSLLFLDEPTSGLDPGLEEALMLLLRELAYKGKTVVLVTHTLDNIHLCDSVVLLVDGRLAFHGPPREARGYFGIDHMVELYRQLKEKDASEWQQRFRDSQEVVEPPAEPPTADGRGVAAPVRRSAGTLRQLAILTRRYLQIVTRDVRNAGLLLAQAPLIAGLIGVSLLYGESDIAYTKPKNTILFLLALTSFWFGCSNAARELVKERGIYLRERMVNLQILPYVLSKLGVLGLLAVVQCLLFLLILDRWFGVPGSFAVQLGAMLLGAVVGILLGLALSALASTADRAMTLLPLLLIPQVLFTSPAVQMDMKGTSGIVARAMPTWWSFDLMRRVALAPGQSIDDDALEDQLAEGGPVLMTRHRFQAMLSDGYMMFDYRDAIEVTWVASLPDALGGHLPEALGRRRAAVVDVLVLLGLATILLAATVLLIKRLDRRE